jgi:hypothetical protein
LDGANPTAVCAVSETVLLAGHPAAVEALLDKAALPNPAGPMRDALALAAAGHHHLVVGFAPPPGLLADWGEDLTREQPPLATAAEALAEARSLALALDFFTSAPQADPVLNSRARLHLYFAEEEAATQARSAAGQVLEWGRSEVRAGIEGVKETLESPDNFLLKAGNLRSLFRAVQKILVPLDLALQKATVDQRGREVQAELFLGDGVDLIGGLADVMEWGMHFQVREDLGTLGKALLAYHDQHGHFPRPTVSAPDGRPLLSWRVLLLPHLGQEELFQQFQLEEPWDSEHNRPLLEKIPKAFQPVGFGTRVPYGTLYQLVVGPGALFGGKQDARLADVKDGMEQTILLAEAAEAVPWTKPQDLAFGPGKPLPALGGSFWNGFYVLLADQRPRFLKRPLDEATLRALITPAGGEKVDLKKLP